MADVFSFEYDRIKRRQVNNEDLIAPVSILDIKKEEKEDGMERMCE